jgi:hypothetical protein
MRINLARGVGQERDLHNLVLCLYGCLFPGVPSAPWELPGMVPSMMET